MRGYCNTAVLPCLIAAAVIATIPADAFIGPTAYVSVETSSRRISVLTQQNLYPQRHHHHRHCHSLLSLTCNNYNSRCCNKDINVIGNTVANCQFMQQGRTSLRRVYASSSGEEEQDDVMEDAFDDQLPSSAALATSSSSEASTPWPSGVRKTIGLLASLGTAETLFLTYQKLLNPEGVAALCGVNGGCSNVLSGPYSQFLGIPLTLPAMVAYGSVAVLALLPLLTGKDKDGNVSTATDGWTRTYILALTTAMAVFSSYLMALLTFKLGEFCPWCVTSAVLSFLMAAIAWFNKAVPNKTKAAVMGTCASLITALAAVFIFTFTEATMDVQSVAAVSGIQVGQLQAPPEVRTETTPQALRLAKHLNKLDAKMYGAYWCSHCFEQKEAFGKKAYEKYITYVECSPKGVDNQVVMCRSRDVPGYPTWEINGKLYPGEKTLEELEEISGLSPYKGKTTD